MAKLFENERIDEVNDNLSLIQKTDGLTFGTDALLLAAYISAHYSRALELGGGSGIISMLLLSREKVDNIDCCEVQDEYAALIERNAELNRLSSRLKVLACDVRELSHTESYELVFSNPPYMKASGGKNNQNDKKSIARHEILGDINDFVSAASRSLKYGGIFYAVYRPDRLLDIIVAMRHASLEVKRMTFVHADTSHEASMVLIEGKKGGKSGMHLTRPFIIYKDNSHKEYTEEMTYVMENGSFPKMYNR